MERSTLGTLLIGAVVWLILLAAVPAAGSFLSFSRIALFALLIITPLGFSLAKDLSASRSRLFETAVFLLPYAMLIAASSFLLTEGVLAGTLAIVWIPVSGLMAIHLIGPIFRRGFNGPDALLSGTAGLYLLIGAVSFWSARLDGESAAIDPNLSLLPFVHLTIAGFAALLIAGCTAGRLRTMYGSTGGFFNLVAVLFLIGPSMQSYAASTGSPLVRAGIAIVIAGGYAGLAWIGMATIARTIQPWTARVLLVGAYAAGAIGMAAAAGSAIGAATGAFSLSREALHLMHGWLMAGGFAGAGMLGWLLADPEIDSSD